MTNRNELILLQCKHIINELNTKKQLIYWLIDTESRENYYNDLDVEPRNFKKYNIAINIIYYNGVKIYQVINFTLQNVRKIDVLDDTLNFYQTLFISKLIINNYKNINDVILLIFDYPQLVYRSIDNYLQKQHTRISKQLDFESALI